MTIAIFLPSSAYEEAWQEPKFISPDLARLMILAIGTMFTGVMITSAAQRRSGKVQLRFTPGQITFLRRAYRWLLILSIVGYIIWAANAIRQGVGVEDLLAVIDRHEGAISDLKSNARPIAGLTTLTQFAPVAIAIGCLLRKLNCGGKSYFWLVLLASIRALFYAERLALIEVVIPLLLLAALTADPSMGRRRRTLTQLGPLLFGPLAWMIFAASEYTRSWIYYQRLTDTSFSKWVSLRMIGYYATSFNNSALLATQHHGMSVQPYFSLNAFWSAPGISLFVKPPAIPEWWFQTLMQNSNPEFNNVGSFLTTYAELGLGGMIVFWLIAGSFVGTVFASLSRGSIPGLIAYSTLFIGILELPRLIYWSQGRAAPLLLSLLLLALRYPRKETKGPRVDRTRAWDPP
jgi:hypothetical protein